MGNQLRYIEISRRNPVTRIFVGTGSSCSKSPTCGDMCIDIERAGQKNSTCAPKVTYNACCQPEPVSQCETNVAHVCASQIDEEGYAVFEWPSSLLSLKEGWYTGTLVSGCSICGEVPVRIGPRCNVLEVEKVVVGPDSACWVGCDETCVDEICAHNTTTNTTTAVYVPAYL